MPSIIGNSTISGSGGNTGPTGPIGPSGATGPRGNTGSIAGATGNTGIYIDTVTFDATRNRLTFLGSNGSVLSVLQGFTGPTGYYSDSRGVSAAISPGYFSGLSGIIAGNTFEFLGISGSGTLVSSMSSDGTEILITPNASTSSGLYGSTLPNNLVFTNSSFSATTTKIGITGTNSILSFGLTADKGATGNSVNVFADFRETYFGVTGGITLGFSGSVPLNSVVVGYDTGGLILDLTKYTTYKINAPVGITAFTVSTDTKSLQSYTLFIEGSDVWNFPKNVYFENSSLGVSAFGFLEGMNIVHLWSDNAGVTFNAAFVGRGIGITNDTAYTAQIGSCCYSNGSFCEDYKTPQECNNLSGTFRPLQSCSQVCVVIGSCCSEGVCRDNVSQTDCSAVGGVFTPGLGSECANAPCGIVKTYDLVISDPINPAILPTGDKLFTLTVETTDTNPVTVNFSSTVRSVTNEDFSNFVAKLPNGTNHQNSMPLTNGTTLGFYFETEFLPNVSGTTASLPITLKDIGSVTQKQKNSPTFTFVPETQSFNCAGCLGAATVSGTFNTTRYCNDCYTKNFEGEYLYYPVQSQSGTINFCVADENAGCGFTLSVNCINVGEVTDINDCGITDPNLTGFSELCPHRDWNLLNNCGGACVFSVAGYPGLPVAHCKGEDLDDGSSAYFHVTTFDNDILEGLNNAQIIEPNDILSIQNNLISEIDNAKRNGTPLLYNGANELSGTSTTDVVCCPVDNAVDIILDFSGGKRYFAYIIITNINSNGTGTYSSSGGGGFGTNGDSCSASNSLFNYYLAIVSTVLDASGDMPQPGPGGTCLNLTYMGESFYYSGTKCSLNHVSTQYPTPGFRYIGEIKQGVNTQTLANGNIVTKQNVSWSSELGVLQGLVGKSESWGWTIDTIPYSVTKPLANDTGLALKYKRSWEFDEYFMKPSVCMGGNFNNTACVTPTPGGCFSSTLGYWFNLKNIVLLNTEDYGVNCLSGNDKIINVVKTGPNEIIPTLWERNPTGAWTKNTTSFLFVSDFAATTNLNQKIEEIPFILSGTHFNHPQSADFEEFNEYVYFYYTDGSNDIAQHPITITKKYTDPDDPINAPNAILVPTIDFLEKFLEYNLETRDLTIKFSIVDNFSEWTILNGYYGYWLETNNGYIFTTIGPFSTDPQTRSINLTSVTINTDADGREYILMHVVLTLLLRGNTENAVLDETQLYGRRFQERNKVLKIYLDGLPEKRVASVNMQKKLLNGQCVNMDCTDLEFFCSGLKDC
jgi:hypothetical protein